MPASSMPFFRSKLLPIGLPLWCAGRNHERGHQQCGSCSLVALHPRHLRYRAGPVQAYLLETRLDGILRETGATSFSGLYYKVKG